MAETFHLLMHAQPAELATHSERMRALRHNNSHAAPLHHREYHYLISMTLIGTHIVRKQYLKVAATTRRSEQRMGAHTTATQASTRRLE